MRPTAVRRASRVLCCPKTHTWVQQRAPLHAPGAVRLRIGLTDRGALDIGDVVLTRPLVPPNSPVTAGSPIMRVQWEGMTISDGDELYHTKWRNVEGHVDLASPCDATVIEVNSDVQAPLAGLEDVEGGWLVELGLAGSFDPEGLLSEEEYEAAVGQEKGLFDGGK